MAILLLALLEEKDVHLKPKAPVGLELRRLEVVNR